MNNYQYNYQNNYPNNGFNNGFNNGLNPMIEKQREKKELAYISKVCGGAVVGFAALGIMLSVIIMNNAKLLTLYRSNNLFQTALLSLVAVFSIVIPFYLAYSSLKSRNTVSALPFGKPEKTSDFLLLIPACMMICIIGSYASGILSSLVNAWFGIEFTEPEDTGVYTTVTGVLLSLFQTALIPALVEEFAIRGVVLQSLRKYGDKFAIIMSAVVFALMHGNMIQIPFAFIAGIAIGYAVIKTGTMWTGIAIHFLNNLISILSSVVINNNSQAVGTAFILISYATIIIVGVLCTVMYLKKNPNIYSGFSHGEVRYLTLSEKVSAFIFTVPTIIAIAFLVYETSMYIKS